MKFKWLLVLSLTASTISAQTKLDSLIPPATPFVTDAAGLFTPSAVSAMNDIARNTQSTLGGDIAVLTLTNIYDYLPTEVALTAGRKWGVGGKAAVGSDQRNLGVVILIVPRTADHGGKCFIGTGRGAEGFITDSKAGSLCRENRTLFQAGNYSSAALNLVTSVAALMQTHVNPPPPVVREPLDLTVLYWILFGLGFVAGVIFLLHQRQIKLDEEQHRRNQELWARQEAVRVKQQADRRRQQEHAAMLAAAAEKARWDALTPDEQAAELAFRAEQERQAAKQREIDEERTRVRRKKQAALDKTRREEEDDNRRRSSSYDSSPSYQSSSDSSSSSSDSYGGGGGFSGGGGGDNF